jgi:hypothetical protein
MKLNGLRQLVKEELRRALDKNDMFKSLKVGETVKYMGEDHKVIEKNEAVVTLERNKTGKKFNLNSSQVNEKVRRAEDFNEIKINKPESPQSRYHRYVMELPRVIQDLEQGETYEVSYKFKDNYGDIGRDKIEISITPEQQKEYYNKSIGFYINDLIDLTGNKVVTIDNVKKVLDEIKITKPGNFNSFIESYTNYLKNISREEMFDESGNYNSTLKGYHDTLKQYAKSGTEEEQLKANFLLGFM